jgi:arylsulfatase A-like enzyme
VDLFPTITDLFGLERPSDVQGTSLVPVLTGEAQEVREYVYATCGGTMPSYLVRSRDYALILYQGGVLRALYDLRKDPEQRVNVIEQEPKQAARLMSAFRTYAATQLRPPLEFVDRGVKPKAAAAEHRVRMSDEQRRQLRNLGYVE